MIKKYIITLLSVGILFFSCNNAENGQARELKHNDQLSLKNIEKSGPVAEKTDSELLLDTSGATNPDGSVAGQPQGLTNVEPELAQPELIPADPQVLTALTDIIGDVVEDLNGQIILQEDMPSKQYEAALECDKDGIIDYTKAGDVPRLLCAIAKGGDVNMNRGSGLGTAILWASRGYGGLDMVKILLLKGADVYAEDGDNDNVLTLSAYYGQKEILGYLIKKGFKYDIDQHNGEPYSALSGAAHAAGASFNGLTVSQLYQCILVL